MLVFKNVDFFFGKVNKTSHLPPKLAYMQALSKSWGLNRIAHPGRGLEFPNAREKIWYGSSFFYLGRNYASHILLQIIAKKTEEFSVMGYE